MKRNLSAKRNLPAPRYDLFISFFEKEVHRYQQAIEELRKLDLPYTLAREALERHRYNNKITLSAEKDHIWIDISCGESHYKEFLPLVSTITQLLYEHSLRVTTDDPNPEVSYDIFWRWKLKGNITMRVKVDVPWNGNQYCQVNFKEVQRTDYERTATWYDEPWRADGAMSPEVTGPVPSPEETPF